jgi:hypothetical protein
MSKNKDMQPKDVEYDKEKVEKARARRHQVKPSAFVAIFVLLVTVVICIAIIEMYQ